MITNGTSTTFTTAPSRGVWFGWGAVYGDQPAWTPGSSSAGNKFTMAASYASGSDDWDMYFYDRSHFASMLINPTGCNPNLVSCYGYAGTPGAELTFADALGNYYTQFVDFDTTVARTYSIHLVDGMVEYRIGGMRYVGNAFASGTSNPLLVVGDGSGSSPSGTGSMTVYSASFDNAAGSFAAAVPEPSAWGMFIGGAAIVGGSLRRRRSLGFVKA
jgi:hypothetical protein